ncbi:hypothetical protein RJ641_010327 [Dillenia turbinata]|uniref:Uncharacterized protein n=1 Tax=Dillenia turbinata TaxID=194707 RepID=A0AAN8V7E9_9MAGN
MCLGVGQVIRGLDQGILGGDSVSPMLVGLAKMNPGLAYLCVGSESFRFLRSWPMGQNLQAAFLVRSQSDCNIPANATLVYDIKFVGIFKGNQKRRKLVRERPESMEGQFHKHKSIGLLGPEELSILLKVEICCGGEYVMFCGNGGLIGMVVLELSEFKESDTFSKLQKKYNWRCQKSADQVNI